MNLKQVDVVKSILGDDIFDEFQKSEISIFKENTNSTVNTEDIKIALQIVPRTILGWLFANLKSKDIGENIDLKIPFAEGRLVCTKLSPDNYSGEIVCEGERKYKFKYRSLPSIGLVLMSTFELYDTDQLSEIKNSKEEKPSDIGKIQDIIEERLKLRELVGDVVDRKIKQREAIKEMMLLRLTHQLKSSSSEDVEKEGPSMTPQESKKKTLKEFLEQRKTKVEKKEINKSEIRCPDCDFLMHKNENDHIRLCVCYGLDMARKVDIKKNEGGSYKLKFPKNFDKENAEMLLEAIKINELD